MTIQELAPKLKEDLILLISELDKSLEGNKSAGSRFRVQLGKLKTQVPMLRAASLKG